MATEQLLSLVDYIAYCARCAYISDLKYMDFLGRRNAMNGLNRVKEDTYPLEQWNDAIEYIAGNPPVGTIADARAILERYLSNAVD